MRIICGVRVPAAGERRDFQLCLAATRGEPFLASLDCVKDEGRVLYVSNHIVVSQGHENDALTPEQFSQLPLKNCRSQAQRTSAKAVPAHV